MNRLLLPIARRSRACDHGFVAVSAILAPDTVSSAAPLIAQLCWCCFVVGPKKKGGRDPEEPRARAELHHEIGWRAPASPHPHLRAAVPRAVGPRAGRRVLLAGALAKVQGKVEVVGNKSRGGESARPKDSSGATLSEGPTRIVNKRSRTTRMDKIPSHFFF